MKAHNPIQGPEYMSPEWYAIRKFDPDRKDRPVIFGASEAAAACNQSPYGSALELYLEKRGEFVREFSPDQQHMLDIGKRLEPIILDVYEERVDAHLTRSLPMYFHPIWSFMAATPDAIASKAVDSETIVEWSVDAKTTSWRMLDKSGESMDRYGADGTDQIPVYNLFQSQVQMAVMGLDRCDFPVLVDGRELRIYTVARNDELIQQIALAEAELSERIVNADPPEPNWEHSGTVRILHRLHGVEAGKVVTLPAELGELWTRKESLSSTQKMIEEEIDGIKAQVMWALGDAQIGRCDEAGIEIKRTVVAESYITEKDVADFSARIGQVKRNGYSLLKGKRLG